ncbi:MAG: acyl carrier protein [Clostridiaceae bacterium]|nr:acyl carrier protein [Clostridiaceae bacterium]
MTKQVVNIVVDLLGVDEEQVTPDAMLIEDLNADSLDAVELAMQLEEYFDIKVEDTEIESMKTVIDIVGTIKRYRPDLEV